MMWQSLSDQSPLRDPEDIVYPSAAPFVLIHLACAGVWWSGVNRSALCLGTALYVMRMIAIGLAYHRYFSHRAFLTSRWFQFVLAVVAQSSAQKSVLWWAAKHRHHHLHADTEEDVHSPARSGFAYAHLGWIFSRAHQDADLSKLGDFICYPELVWLHRFELVPAIVLGLMCFFVAGWPGVIVGFVWSTVLLYHATFCINSLAHTHGSKRYVTGDDSRNNWLLAIVTFGEGWHNNHHAFQSSARQGFRWWEVDATFYTLKVLSWIGLVWDLKSPPASIIRNEQRLGTKVIEKVGLQLANSFPSANFTASIRNELETVKKIEDFIGFSLAAYRKGEDLIPMPTYDDLRRQAALMFVKTSSLDQIIEQARSVIADTLATNLRIGLVSSVSR